METVFEKKNGSVVIKKLIWAEKTKENAWNIEWANYAETFIYLFINNKEYGELVFIE